MKLFEKEDLIMPNLPCLFSSLWSEPPVFHRLRLRLRVLSDRNLFLSVAPGSQ